MQVSKRAQLLRYGHLLYLVLLGVGVLWFLGPQTNFLQVPISDLVEECRVDSDGDQVPDLYDACPHNRIDELRLGVDDAGCPVDRDKDGVDDVVDQCRDTPMMASHDEVDETGCLILKDQDQDGVSDAYDHCPDTISGIKVDEQGCEKFIKMVVPADQSFGSGQSLLSAEAQDKLRVFVEKMTLEWIQQVVVEAHTDAIGNAEDNLRLSQQRAEVVADFLHQLGVAKEKMITRGYGESRPCADNETLEGRAKNRRFELKVKALESE